MVEPKYDTVDQTVAALSIGTGIRKILGTVFLTTGVIYVWQSKIAVRNSVKTIAATTTADIHDEIVNMTPPLGERGVAVLHHLLLKSSTGVARLSTRTPVDLVA